MYIFETGMDVWRVKEYKVLKSIIKNMNIKEMKLKWIKLVFRKIKKVWFKNDGYCGITTGDIIRDNDKYEGIELFFKKRWKIDCKQVPNVGDLICGYIEKNEIGLILVQWSITNYSFLSLWTLVMYPEHPSFYNGIHKKTLFEIINSMDFYTRIKAQLIFADELQEILNKCCIKN